MNFRQLVVEQMQIGTAHAAGLDAQRDFVRAGRRQRHFAQLERCAGREQPHRLHARSLQAAGNARCALRTAGAGGTTTPQVMIIFSAASTDISSSTTWRRGRITR